MKITIDEHNEFLLENVYTGIGLKSDDGETFNIVMRDTGFEFKYQGKWYEAKQGTVRPLMTIEK